MGDKWLLDYDGCLHQAQDIMESITERNRQPCDGTFYAKKSAEIRTSLSAFSRDIIRLRESLNQSALQRRLTERECDRRQAMMDNLVTRHKQLELTFENRDQRHVQRTNLLGGTRAFGDDPWSFVEAQASMVPDDQTMSVDQIRQQQQQIIAEQDEGLEALSRVVGHQKQIALDIGNEVESQNDIIDDIIDHTHSTNTRLIRETQHIKILDHKSGACSNRSEIPQCVQCKCPHLPHHFGRTLDWYLRRLARDVISIPQILGMYIVMALIAVAIVVILCIPLS